ncbi:MAG: DNA mismatch repair endonuclease MutL, partial [Bdellovibrionaceae bacterium]|nr:DNA mismatch repair endonuclease MutL [Pseudobdellovibrionaceae bacterium]
MAIHVLPPDVVDQIAAGEVVERPAHMVKELIENSLDAGARRIEVDFSLGGRAVQVRDDGSGIDSEDLAKALDRFATSKIRSADDLWRLKSFGFRGEALASISAVSELTMISRPPGAERAARVKSTFGRRGAVESVGGDPGTTVVVENLFENVPARLKFLKSSAAEHTQIKNTLKALALSHPQVEFRVREEGKLIFAYSPGARLQRCEQVLEVKPLYEGSAECDGVKATVIFAAPDQVARSAKNIWIFVQNRWVQDRGLQTAVFEAYRGLLMHGEYPYVC